MIVPESDLDRLKRMTEERQTENSQKTLTAEELRDMGDAKRRELAGVRMDVQACNDELVLWRRYRELADNCLRILAAENKHLEQAITATKIAIASSSASRRVGPLGHADSQGNIMGGPQRGVNSVTNLRGGPSLGALGSSAFMLGGSISGSVAGGIGSSRGINASLSAITAARGGRRGKASRTDIRAQGDASPPLLVPAVPQAPAAVAHAEHGRLPNVTSPSTALAEGIPSDGPASARGGPRRMPNICAGGRKGRLDSGLMKSQLEEMCEEDGEESSVAFGTEG